MIFDYQDTATFVIAKSSGYDGSKTMVKQIDVNVVFVQNTGFDRVNFQDGINADAICWVDPDNSFVKDNYNRLEGMYVLEPLFGAGDSASWYKVTDVTVNRDHLLTNRIDNIELRLKKTTAIPGVS